MPKFSFSLPYLLCLLCLITLSACAPSSARLRQAGEAAVYDQQWLYYDTTDFEIQIPSSWKMEYVDPYGVDGPQLVIYGTTPQGAIDDEIRVLIFKEDTPLIESLDKYTELSAFNIQNAAAIVGGVTTRFITLPIGRVSQLRFRSRSFDNLGATTVHDVEQYLLLRDGKAYGLSMNVPAHLSSYYRPIFEAITETWFFHEEFSEK